MSFRISGLPAAQFSHLFGLDDDALEARGVKRYSVDAKPGFPDRVSLRDLEPGESALLLNYVHQTANTPYRASHAIFVAEHGVDRFDQVNEVPDALRVRTLSLRGFDAQGMMLDADLVDGEEIGALIERMFKRIETAYIHAHFAKRGCFAARVDRG